MESLNVPSPRVVEGASRPPAPSSAASSRTGLSAAQNHAHAPQFPPFAAVVHRVGEVFAEFGVDFPQQQADASIAAFGLTKWSLLVYSETNLEEPAVSEELSVKQLSKTVKVRPNCGYVVEVRLYSDSLASWSECSPRVRTCTFASVVTSIAEIGEDYVRILWDRPQRDTTNIAAEKNPGATSAVASITGFELRVLREADMIQEFSDEFPNGVRTYTLHELKPATAYVVMVRYKTLIGSVKQWTEACRFYTQAAHELTLAKRAEDTVSFQWARSLLPASTIGYHLPDNTIHKYEIVIEGAGADDTPIQLAASTNEYTADNLSPSTLYKVKLRCLTKEGRWGTRTKPLCVTTADRAVTSVAALGETFLSVSWLRMAAEPDETLVEYIIKSASSSYTQQKTIPTGPDLQDKVFHITGLASGTEYVVTMRTFLHGAWGRWTEPLRVRTRQRASLVFLERGENFLTVNWPVEQELSSDEKRTNAGSIFNVVVSKIDNEGTHHAVLDEEVTRYSDHEGFRVERLQQDSRYDVRCRRWQRNPLTGFEGWGEFSNFIRAQTLQSVALQALDVGEDFAQLSWRRGMSSNPEQPTSSQPRWLDLKYEVVVGCLDTGEDRLIHREVLETTYTVSNLRPSTRYVVSVRACDEREQWGLWSKLYLTTLSAVTSGVHEIGEDYVRVTWERKAGAKHADITAGSGAGLPPAEQTSSANAAADTFVTNFTIFVYSNDFANGPIVPHADAGYPSGGNSEISVLEVVEPTLTSLRIGNLLPDRQYVAVVRAATASGKKGLWSEPLIFNTVPQFRIPINSLNIGENYIHMHWSRDEHPAVAKNVHIGNMAIMGQELRIFSNDKTKSTYSKEHKLGAEPREIKLQGLSPATAYTIQIRSCNSFGEWGLWSPPLNVLTRCTIATRTLEIAEDYCLLAWDRKKANNPNNFPTGKGFITSYHLRVQNKDGVHSENFLGDGDCPYRISGLAPDTFYLVELKANYNDEEWGLWSTPLWILTMKPMELRIHLISEEFVHVKIARPNQVKRLPEDDGNVAQEDRVIALGQPRTHCMLCVTSAAQSVAPHATAPRARNAQSGMLPLDCLDQRIVYQVELTSDRQEITHQVSNLRPSTIYSASVRSKLNAGEWGMWTSPSLRFATVPTISVGFTAVGENFATVEWKREQQAALPSQRIQCGLGIFSQSRLKIRDVNGSAPPVMYNVENSTQQLIVEGLEPAKTYAVAVQTFNDNHDWGVWSEESKLRTVPPISIQIQHCGEDAVWLQWSRESDIEAAVALDTALNVDSLVKHYEIQIVGDGHFVYNRELEGQSVFFRGLIPDQVFTFSCRAMSKNGQWGIWASKMFRTLPTMRVTFGNIGEHFAVVEWRRHLPTAKAPPGCSEEDVVESSDIVQEYRLKVEQTGHDPVVYELSPNTSSFRLTDLQPSAEYRVWMCAKGYQGVWGLWNQEARVRTLPQLELTITDIGEEYVALQWTRKQWEGEHASAVDGVKVFEIHGAVSGYQLEIHDENGRLVSSHNTPYTQQSFVIERLALRSLYTVQVRARDTYNEWGLWSEIRKFVTLQPVKINLLRIGEDHLELEWNRRTRLAKRHIVTEDAEDEDHDDDDAEDDDAEDDDERHGGSVSNASHAGGDLAAPALYSQDDFEEDVKRGNEDVLQWHVRVYPSKLFGGMPGAEEHTDYFMTPSATQFRVQGLTWNTTYTIAVRAQNSAGKWGSWSETSTITTIPRLSTTVKYIGETFILVGWTRPEMEHAELKPLGAFPPAHDIHNYQVQIRPLASEKPFDDSDEPTVDGARVYETSQQHLQLSNLLPGVRYRIEVREQTRKEADGTVSFGVFSEMRIVETIEAMTVVPVEIGENYAAISWRRCKRSDDEQSLSITRSLLKPTMFEMRAVRLDDEAEDVYKGTHNNLNLVKTFPVNVNSFHVPHLVPNAIYAIEVRAQTEGGYWGLWSQPSKFITLKRLNVTIELINEDNVLVSWSRQLPDWAQEVVPGIGLSPRGDDVNSAADDGGLVESNMSMQADDESARRSGQAADTTSEGTAAAVLSPALQAVILGDYSVSLFELYVDGVSAEFSQKLCMPNSKSSTRVSGLSPGVLYSVRIRSRSEKEIWSLCSAHVSFCTLKPMQCVCDTFTENLAKVSWEREAQSISEHSKVLAKTQENLKREIEQQERKARIHLQQLRQEQEVLQEQGVDQHAIIEEISDVQRQLEEISDDVTFLNPDRVQIGKIDVSAFQIRLFGDRGVPFISGTSHILPVKKRNRKKIVAQISRQQSIVGKKKRQTVLAVDQRGGQEEDEAEAAMPDDERILLDVKVNPRTQKLDILGLEPNTTYEYCVRSRNSFNEWGPWSARLTVVTLNLITLDHTRFGEHYINLFWHRQSLQSLQDQRNQEEIVRKYTDEFKGVTAESLRLMKASCPPEDYQAFVARFKDWRARQRATAAAQSRLEEGGGEVVTASGSVIQGYHLRLIHENGTFRDCYVKESAEAPSRQFTLSGLMPNTMYVVMLCADYGINEWGTWTEPLKFMTQNLIQLQITYVGESFIDIEWRRAPNKKLQKYDEGSVLVNPTAQGRGHTYEVSLKFTNPSTGEEVEELRPAADCNVFRVDRLFTDCRYVVAVREWDPKSEWGLWSGSRSCVTLAGMRVTVHEVGEHWMNLSWLRVASSTEIKTDASLVLLPVESLSFYLRVEELVDNGAIDTQADGKGSMSPLSPHLPHHHGEGNGDERGDAGSDVSGDETDLHLMFDIHSPGGVDEDHSSGPLPPQEPPTECNPFEHGESRYVFIKKFSFEVTELRIEDLRPDRFYSVQVLCETTGGQLGGWSVDTTVLTLSKIHVRADLLDEDCARLSWVRDPPRQHPRLKAFVITGDYRTESYELEARGMERKNADYFVTHKLPRNVQEFRLSDLFINSAYSVRVRSFDTQQRSSMWADSLNFATLKQLRVLAGRITENAAHVEWGRDVQSASEYPDTDTPIVFGQEKASQYHLRVFTPNEREVPFVDKLLSGNHSRFALSGLAPNSAYIVQARSCNLVAEWGMWSEERIVYTMPLIQPSILTVGEDYLLIQWERSEPTELTELVQQVDLSTRSGVIDDDFDAVTGDDQYAALRTLQMKKRYPLLDRPATRSQVYCSARTKITNFTICVAKRGDVDGLTYEVQNTGKFTFRVDTLHGDTPYTVTVRACYSDDDWGMWSTAVNTATLNLLAAECRFVGEDYLTAEWHRTSNSFPTTDLEMGRTEETLSYQLLVHDYTEVPIGAEAEVNMEALVVRDTLVASRSATIRGLKSNRRYRLAVRRWFRPIVVAPVALAELAEGEKAPTEEQRLKDLMDRSGAMSGAWSEAVFIITLKDMVVLVDDVAEDFLQVHWERDPQAAVLPSRSCQRVVTVVQNYHVRLDQMTSDGSAVDNGPGTLHLDQVFGSEDTHYRVPDIKADHVYKVDVRCLADKVWGQWSTTVYVVALAKLEIEINSIGENYVSISWQRNIRQLVLPDGTRAIVGSNVSVDKYQLEMCGIDHHFRLDKRFKASRTSYRVKHIDAAQLYSVCVRSCDVNTNAWSLWSDRVVFATLKPLALSLGKVGEQFVHVSWFRELQTKEEYASHDPNVHIGKPDVSWYHLCVFGLEQSPATAIVDKQFAGDVLRYRVTTLAPNTSYIVIVRSCNSEDQWGLWSDERIVKTQRLLSVSIVGIGENYLRVKFEREDGGDVRDETHDKNTPQAIKTDPILFHLALTSEKDTLDKQFTIDECTPSKDDPKAPTITVNGLSSDTKYICALQPCYGNDEWGMWTKQLTFVTLNKISVTASNVTESSVDLAWGRAQQSVEIASDPSVITWRSTIAKYQLLMRKAQGANPLDVPEHIGQPDTAPPIAQLTDAPAPVEAASPTAPAPPPAPVPSASAGKTEIGDASPPPGVSPGHGDIHMNIASSLDERNLDTGTSAQSLSSSIPAAAVAPPQPPGTGPATSLVPPPERKSEFLIEREMEMKGKYVQSTCSIDNLHINTDYLVQVRAMDDQGYWGCWTELLFDTPPPPPANVTLKKSGAQYVLLAWEPADANRYQYCVEQAIAREAPVTATSATASARRRQEPLEWRVVDTVEDCSCRIRAFGPHNKIRCRVKCCKLDKQTHLFSKYSEIASLSSSNPPEPVQNLVLSMLSRQSAAIEWERPAGGGGGSTPPQDALMPQPPKPLAYRVLLGVKEQAPVLLATTRAMTYIMNDLEPNTTYRVQVQVEGEGGLSQKNTILKFTTKLDSDKTVSKAQHGQAPLGIIATRPGTGGDDEARLPSIVHKPGAGVDAHMTARKESPSRRATSAREKQDKRGGAATDDSGSKWTRSDPYGLGFSKTRAESASVHATRGHPSPQKEKELYNPQPPAQGKQGKHDAAPRRTVPPQASGPKKTSPQKQRGASPPRKPQERHVGPEGTLPPLAVRRGAPPQGSGAAVEEYDVVGFSHSDDERN
jgi:chitodextrinase